MWQVELKGDNPGLYSHRTNVLEAGICCFVLRDSVIGVSAHLVSIRKVELEA